MTFITPELARTWLQSNTNNRTVIRGCVPLFREALESGDYVPTHQGIGFWEDGELADGQHRLMAISEAGVGAWMNVSHGLKRQAIHAIDRGRSRTHGDSLHFMGMNANRNHIAVCQCLIYQFECQKEGKECWSTYKQTSYRFALYYQKFIQPISFVCDIPGSASLSAPIRAAVALAYYTEEITRLTDFVKVLCTCEMSSECDNAAIRLVRHIQQVKSAGGHGTKARYDLFVKTCSAARHFLDHMPISRLTSCKEHVFTFPSSVIEG